MGKLKEPVLFINFKTYESGTGKNALELAKLCEKISKETGKSIVAVVQATDLRLVSDKTKIPVFAQHIDPIVYGKNTGGILPEAVKEAGAVGVVINHAENKRSNDFVEKAVSRARECDLISMVCAENIERAIEVASFNPDYIAIEVPELIGGTLSVSTANPDLIIACVKKIAAINKGISVITGAGVNSRNDVSKAIEFGTKGVFVSYRIMKEPKPEIIEDLVSGF